MLLAHRRTKSGQVSVALGQPTELALLADAAQRYASAAAKGPISASLYIEWGNVLRASGDFAGAVEKYLRAADLNPADTSPRLNMAVAFLDRVEYGVGAGRAVPPAGGARRHVGLPVLDIERWPVSQLHPAASHAPLRARAMPKMAKPSGNA